MGMGDKKRPFEPTYGKVLDMVYNLAFSECAVRECPHPAVIKKYGVGGKATVSIYTCKKCKYSEKDQWCGGWKCRYGVELQARAEDKLERNSNRDTGNGEHG